MAHVLTKFEKPELVTAYRNFIAEFPGFVELSRDTAYNRAESYREFEVGNVGIGIRPGIDGFFTYSGANFKVKYSDEDAEDASGSDEDHAPDLHDGFDIPRDVPKVCAEMATVAAVEDEDIFFLAHVTTATSSTQEIYDVTGVQTRTLPPCDACVPVLDASPNTSRATLYAAASLDADVCQVRNIRLLKKLHSTKQERKLAVGRFGGAATLQSLEYYDRRIATHHFNGAPHSRAIASFARSALTSAVSVKC